MQRIVEKDKTFFLIIHETAKNPLCVLPSSIATGRFSRSLTPLRIRDICNIIRDSRDFYEIFEFFFSISSSISLFLLFALQNISEIVVQTKRSEKWNINNYLCRF